LLIVFSNSFAQTILNNSFENWTTYFGTGGAFTGEYPTNWTSSDSLYQALAGAGVHSAEREISDHCNLLYSVKLTTISALGQVGPGVATNGRVTGINTVAGGSPDTARSAQFSGCYKYTAAGTDSGFVTAFLFKWNTTTHVRDTIGVARLNTKTTSGITNFAQPFMYKDYSRRPDSLLIILSSSQGLNLGVAGSKLVVDNLSLSGYVGIAENISSVKSVRIFPSPATEYLNVNVELLKNINMSYVVMDAFGKIVLQEKMNSSSEKINISSLSSGNYFFNLRDEEGNQLYSGRFVVAK
jgi:hypothetical protein